MNEQLKATLSEKVNEALNHLRPFLHADGGDMELVEIIDDTFAGKNLIYRYKANFEKNDFLNEIRIWVNMDGKFSGIIFREWKDEYIPYK